MSRIYFIRHGATAGNLKKRYIGRTDEPLCELGRRQLEPLREHHLQVDCLFASPALRTRQTAELLFPGMEPSLVTGLWETDFGIFEGKSAAELAGEPAYQAWVDSWCRDPIPGGERVDGFKARCCAAFRSCMAQVPQGSTAVFVIHGGCIMAILEAFAVPKRDFYDYQIPNGGWVECEWQQETIRID